MLFQKPKCQEWISYNWNKLLLNTFHKFEDGCNLFTPDIYVFLIIIFMLPRGIRNNNPLNIRRSKISGRAYEPNRQMQVFVSLRVWSMVGVLLSCCSRVPIVTSTGSIPSGWLSANGHRPGRIWQQRISRTWAALRGLRPTSLSASHRISPSAGWRLVWRWRFRRTEQSLLITLRC